MARCGSSPPCLPIGVPGIQCTNSFNCDDVNKVCVQYRIAAAGGKPSSCRTQVGKQNACITSAGDGPWAYGSSGGSSITSCSVALCSNVPTSRCTTINPNNPPKVCAGPVYNAGLNNNISISDPNAPNNGRRPNLDVTCQWDITDFSTVDAINAYTNVYGEGGSCNVAPCRSGGVANVFDEVIMPYFCSIPDVNSPAPAPPVCPGGSAGGVWVGNKCSKLVSNSDGSVLCTKWLNRIKSSNNRKAIQAANALVYGNYCSVLSNESVTNPNLIGGEINECVCINRGKGGATGLLGQITQGTGGDLGSLKNPLAPIGCWYTPCNAGVSQLVPIDTGPGTPIHDTYYPDSCPNVCQIINNIQGTIQNTTVNENINCQGVPVNPSGGGGTGGGGNGGGGNGGNGTSTDQSFFGKYKWGFVIGGGVILIVIIIIIVIATTRGKKKKKKDGIDPALLTALSQ